MPKDIVAPSQVRSIFSHTSVFFFSAGDLAVISIRKTAIYRNSKVSVRQESAPSCWLYTCIQSISVDVQVMFKSPQKS